VKTGKLLWKHELANNHDWKMYPSFSPDGQYAGFHNGGFDGGSCLHLVNTLALPWTEATEIINIGNLSRSATAFAIGPRGRRVALLQVVSDLTRNIVSTKLAGRQIDLVPCGQFAYSPHIEYTLSGETVFLSYIEEKSLNVRIFDVRSGNAEFEHRIDHVTSSICKGLAYDSDDDFLFLVHVNVGPWGVSFRWGDGREESRAIAINRKGIKTGDHYLSPRRLMFVSQYNALFIGHNGEVLKWDCRSASDEGVEHVAWTKDNQKIEMGEVVVAFKDRRLTLISSRGECKFIDTE
jgi:hypothetical protein